MAEALTHFHRALRARIVEVLEARQREMSQGVCKDFGHYKQDVGYCLGLQDALKLAEDVERDMDR